MIRYGTTTRVHIGDDDAHVIQHKRSYLDTETYTMIAHCADDEVHYESQGFRTSVLIWDKLHGRYVAISDLAQKE